MDDLTPVAELNGGYLMRHQLNDLGYSDPMIRQAMRAQRLTRVRHGTYVVTQVWRTFTASERHAVLTRSVLDKLGPNVVATHQSAAALHGFDLYGADLASIHVTRLDGHRGRREAGVVFHEGDVQPDDLGEVDGRLVIVPMRAVFEACSLLTTESGMVLASSAMRVGGLGKDELEEFGRRFDHWPGTRVARLAIRLSDPRLESVGEVRSLHMMWRHGVPYPELQWKVADSCGDIVARTDYAWIEACHTGEFDGLVKYGRLNPYTVDIGRVLADEKVREDRVRDEGLGMTRWVWADLRPNAQAATAEKLLRGIERSRKAYSQNATTIT